MLIRQRLPSVCLLLVWAGCGGSAESSGREPGAAMGEAATPTSGAETPPAPTPPPAADPPAPEPPAPKMPQHGLMLIQKVKDYDAWKTAFDANADARKQAGLDGHSIMRGLDDAKLVVVWAPVSDIEKAKTFVEDKAQKDKMKQAGVQGKPEVQLSNVSAMQMDPSKKGLPAAVLTAKVKDFAAFKTAFESGTQARTDAGIVGYALSQDATTPTVAYVYLQSEDPAKLKTYVTAKETKQAWKDAGVVGPAKVTLVQESESVMYP